MKINNRFKAERSTCKDCKNYFKGHCQYWDIKAFKKDSACVVFIDIKETL